MEKQRWEESEKRRAEERRSEKRKSQKKEDAGARKGRKVAKHCVFPMICGSGGSQSRLAEAAGAEPSGQMRDKKLHALVARSTFRSHMYKTHSKHTILGPLLEVEMLQECAPLWREAHLEAKCTKHIQNTPFILGPLWKLRPRNSARRCGEKHIWKPNVQNTLFSDHFWKMRYCKSARRLKVLARSTFGSQNSKALQLWSTFGSWDVEKAHAVVVRSTFRSQKCKKWRVRSTFGRSDVVSCGRGKGLCTLSKVSKTWGFCSSFSYNHHYTTLHSTTPQLQPQLQRQRQRQLHYTTLHYTTLIALHYTALHPTTTLTTTTTTSTTTTTTTLHYTTLHYATLRYTTLHYATLITLHCAPLHFTTLHDTTLNYTTTTATTTTRTTLRYTTLITLHITLHYANHTTLYYTMLHYATLHYTRLRYTTLHYTPLHYTPLHHATLKHTTLHITLHYTHYTTPHLQLQLHHTNYTTLQLQLRHYTTLHPAVVGEVTTATNATTEKNATPTTFRSIRGFALPSMHHNNSPLL